MRHEDDRLELRLRLFAPPAALLFAYVVTSGRGGSGFARIFAGMWLHELGHAITAWWSGFFAIPGPWRTITADHRSVVVSLVLFAGLAALGVHGHRTERRPLIVTAIALVLVQAALTLVLRRRQAEALILFGGDAGAMILGAALMATFHVPPGSRLHTTWLRWGFLVLGALAFFDAFRPWWRARRDPDAIPFGEIEGVGDSDPTRLVDEHGWDIRAMVTRHVTLGVVCLLALAAVHLLGVLSARRRLDAAMVERSP